MLCKHSENNQHCAQKAKLPHGLDLLLYTIVLQCRAGDGGGGVPAIGGGGGYVRNDGAHVVQHYSLA